ncbi:MAG: hypothetical protein IJ803_08830 [Oribacterium sp.]|nr:hypothetical protein [Oribacterium sp.]
MRKESEIKEKLTKEVNAFLTCPKFAVEEHANAIYTLAWVLNMTENEVSELLIRAEKEMRHLKEG